MTTKLLLSPSSWWVDGNISGAAAGVVVGAFIWGGLSVWWVVALSVLLAVWLVAFLGVVLGIALEEEKARTSISHQETE